MQDLKIYNSDLKEYELKPKRKKKSDLRRFGKTQIWSEAKRKRETEREGLLVMHRWCWWWWVFVLAGDRERLGEEPSWGREGVREKRVTECEREDCFVWEKVFGVGQITEKKKNIKSVWRYLNHKAQEQENICIGNRKSYHQGTTSNTFG